MTTFHRSLGARGKFTSQSLKSLSMCSIFSILNHVYVATNPIRNEKTQHAGSLTDGKPIPKMETTCSIKKQWSDTDTWILFYTNKWHSILYIYIYIISNIDMLCIQPASLLTVEPPRCLEYDPRTIFVTADKSSAANDRRVLNGGVPAFNPEFWMPSAIADICLLWADELFGEESSSLWWLPLCCGLLAPVSWVR